MSHLWGVFVLFFRQTLVCQSAILLPPPPLHALVLAKWKLIYFLFWLMFISITHPVLWENTRLSASALCRASSRAMFLLLFEWLNHNLPRTASVGLVTFMGGSDTVLLMHGIKTEHTSRQIQISSKGDHKNLSGIYVRANTHTHTHTCVSFTLGCDTDVSVLLTRTPLWLYLLSQSKPDLQREQALLNPLHIPRWLQ